MMAMPHCTWAHRVLVAILLCLHSLSIAFILPVTRPPSCGREQSIAVLHLRTTSTCASAREHRANLATVPTTASLLGAIAHPSPGGGDGAVDSIADDPFRPERASMSPVVINALAPVLFREAEAADAATAAVKQRNSSSDWSLTEDEGLIVTRRVCGVADNLSELRFMLATVVGRTPWIAKYGMLPDYGMSDNVDSDPLAQMSQAECLLALYMLYMEKTGAAAIDFLDADRLEVLGGCSTS